MSSEIRSGLRRSKPRSLEARRLRFQRRSGKGPRVIGDKRIQDFGGWHSETL